jgi:hypothetical protein
MPTRDFGICRVAHAEVGKGGLGTVWLAWHKLGRGWGAGMALVLGWMG